MRVPISSDIRPIPGENHQRVHLLANGCFSTDSGQVGVETTGTAGSSAISRLMAGVGREFSGKLRKAAEYGACCCGRKGARRDGAVVKANPGTEQGPVGIGGSHGRCESAGLGTGLTMAAAGIGATPPLGSGCETSERIGF